MSRYVRSRCGAGGCLHVAGACAADRAGGRTGADSAGSGARGDRAGRDADPIAVTLLVGVRVEGFLMRAVGEQGVGGTGVDQGDVTEDADFDVVHGEIL